MDIGARLRDAREARGLSIDAVSRSTRVQSRILSAIERNDSMCLPPRPYGRGFVRAYASEVGLDPEVPTAAVSPLCWMAQRPAKMTRAPTIA